MDVFHACQTYTGKQWQIDELLGTCSKKIHTDDTTASLNYYCGKNKLSRNATLASRSLMTSWLNTRTSILWTLWDQQVLSLMRGFAIKRFENVLTLWYSGLPLIRPPLGPVKVSWLEGRPHFRGEFALGGILCDILKWPKYRGGLISGVQIRGSSLYFVPWNVSLIERSFVLCPEYRESTKRGFTALHNETSY